MSDEIRPALSADEWERGAYDGVDVSARQRTASLTGRPRLDIEVRSSPIGSDVLGDPRDLLALAALALYGQPFGFTWDDVRACRDDLNHYVEDREEMLRTLAAKIAALLPPREEG